MKKYICSFCGWILIEPDSKPEDQVRCPKCGHEVMFWKKVEDEVESRR
jgi:DNA-directed RNA polymerase subunit RPC12/RpoP